MNSFKKYFWDVIRNHYVDFDGVATRKQFWLFGLWELTVIYLPSIISALLQLWHDSLLFVIMFMLFALILPNIAISVRRLHDAGFSGWLLLLNFIPYIGGIIIFILYLLPSEIHDNKYRSIHKNN